jgi:hypothetical protein
MRPLVAFTVLAIALAVPAAGLAVGDGSADGTLSVKNARGLVQLQPFNGSAIGRIGRGRVVITDSVFDDGAGFDFWGCDTKFDKSDTTTVCSGSNLRFRAIGGSYRIVIRGAGISVSAVGRGTVLLDGRGEDPDVNDGSFALNDSPYKSLPNVPRPYVLSAPSGD